MAIIYDFLRSVMLPLREIDDVLPKKGKIIDLGCGEGVMAKFLAKTTSRDVIGVDDDKKRLQKSNIYNLTFTLADIKGYDLKGADAIIISDVLHHLTYQDQDKLIKNVAKSLKRGGVFVIKEIDTGEFTRSKLSRIWDFVFYPNDKIYYHNAIELSKALKSKGFKVKITRPTRFFPGSTTLFVCQKL